MCFEPATMSLVMAGLSAMSSVAGGVVGMQQANAQAATARNNAILAERSAQDALERASEEESRQRRDAGQLFGEQIARMAANGLDLSVGSPLKALGDTKILEEEDASRILETGRRNAYSFQVEAQNYRSEAKSARQSGIFGLGTSIIGAASQFGSSVYSPAPRSSVTPWQKVKRAL